eukprot:GEMP01008525.1.p1 GENE.GEMP01008525.1~~GEMP01008525.1.p1  ORF type:complete len:764 (+),score=204.16 GEMP01008525.1:76-2367(+)
MSNADAEFDLDAYTADLQQQMKSLGVDTAQEAGPSVDKELADLMRTCSGEDPMDKELAELFAEENKELQKVVRERTPPAQQAVPAVVPVSSPAAKTPVKEIDDLEDDEEDYGEFTWEEVEMIWNPSNMESYEVMEWVIAELTKKAETDEEAEDNLGGAQLKFDILVGAIESETLSKEMYEQKVKARMNRDRQLSQWLADHNRKEQAAIVLKRSRIAQTELRSAGDAAAGPADAPAEPGSPSLARKALTKSLTREMVPAIKELSPEEMEQSKEIATPLDEIIEAYRDGAGKWMEIHKAALGRVAQETQKARKDAVGKFAEECLRRMKAMIEIAEIARTLKPRVLQSMPDEAKKLMASSPAPVTPEVLVGMSENERQAQLTQYLKIFKEEEAVWKQTAVKCLRNDEKEKGAEYNRARQQCQFWQKWLEKAIEDPLQPLPVVQDEVVTQLREKSFANIPEKTIRIELTTLPGSPELSSNCVFHVDLGISSADYPTVGKGDILCTGLNVWVGDIDLSELKDSLLERRVGRSKLSLELEQIRSAIWMGLKNPKQLGVSRTKIKLDPLMTQCEFSDSVMIIKEGERKSDLNISCLLRMRTPITKKEMVEEHVTHPKVYLLPPSLASVTIKAESLDAALPTAQPEEPEPVAAPAPVFNTRPPLDQQMKDPTSPLLMNSVEALETTWPVLEKMGMVKRCAQLKAKQARIANAIEEGQITLEEYIMRMKEDQAADQLLANELKSQKRTHEGVVVLKRIKAMADTIKEASAQK